MFSQVCEPHRKPPCCPTLPASADGLASRNRKRQVIPQGYSSRAHDETTGFRRAASIPPKHETLNRDVLGRSWGSLPGPLGPQRPGPRGRSWQSQHREEMGLRISGLGVEYFRSLGSCFRASAVQASTSSSQNQTNIPQTVLYYTILYYTILY